MRPRAKNGVPGNLTLSDLTRRTSSSGGETAQGPSGRTCLRSPRKNVAGGEITPIACPLGGHLHSETISHSFRKGNVMSEESLVKQVVAQGTSMGGAVLLVTVGVLELLQGLSVVAKGEAIRRRRLHLPVRPHRVGMDSPGTRRDCHRYRYRPVHRCEVGTVGRHGDLRGVDPRQLPLVAPLPHVGDHDHRPERGCDLGCVELESSGRLTGATAPVASMNTK